MRLLTWLAATLIPITFAQSVSKTARCGPSFGHTCKKSKYGDCCSQYSYCGSTDAYCGRGCQAGFGDCKGKLIRRAAVHTLLTLAKLPLFRRQYVLAPHRQLTVLHHRPRHHRP
jgi:hypothetical protein